MVTAFFLGAMLIVLTDFEHLRNIGTDPDGAFLELNALAAWDMYDGQAPGAGIVTGIGRIEGTTCVVVANDATRRWLGADPRGPGWVRLLHRVSAPVLGRTPPGLAERAVRFQRPWMPLLMPVAPTTAHPSSLVDSAPLYAGQGISRINDVRRTIDIVAELAGH